MEQAAFDTGVPQDRGGAVERPTLADGPGMDFDPGDEKPDGMGFRVESDMMPAHARQGAREG